MQKGFFLFAAAIILTGCGLNRSKFALSEAEINREFNRRLTPEERKLVDIPFLIPDSIIESYKTATFYMQNDEKLEYLANSIILQNRFGLEYKEDGTYTAKELLEKKSGNCISFSHLLIGLTRALDLESQYIYILKNPTFSVYENTLSVNYHVMTGIQIDREIRFYDFQPGYERSFLRLYSVNDLEAIALHYNNLGAEYITLDSLLLAKKYLNISRKLAPKNSEILSNYALLLMRTKRYEEAKKYLWQAVNYDRSCYPAWHNLLYLAIAEDDQKMFITLKKELRNTNSPTIKLFLANLAYREKNYENTIDYLERIDPEKTKLYTVYLLKAQAMYKLGQYKTAKEMLNLYLSLGDENIQADFLKLELDKLVK